MKKKVFGLFKNKKKSLLMAVAALSIMPWFAQAGDALDMQLDNSPAYKFCHHLFDWGF